MAFIEQTAVATTVKTATLPLETPSSPTSAIIESSEEKRLSKVLMALDTSDKEGLREALHNLITVGLFNQFHVQKGIGIGLLTDRISVQDAPLLMSKLEKPSELIKVLKALDGGSSSETVECFAQFVKRAYETASEGDVVSVGMRTTKRVL